MFKQHSLAFVLTLLVLLSLTGGPASAQGEGPDMAAAALGTAFTYQGQLKDGSGNPVSNTCDFQFRLYDALTDGNQVGSTLTKTNVTVGNGLFSLVLDFGSGIFTGSARWLGISARCPGGGGSYTSLTPRQELTPAPYALYSSNSGSLSGHPGTFYLDASNISAGTLGTGYFSAIADLSAEGYLGNASGDLGRNNGTLQSNLNADMLDGQHASTFQNQVTGTCAVGNTIRTINADGSVVCQFDAPLNRASGPRQDVIYNVDSTIDGDTGKYNSITIGTDGLPIISYYDVTNADLRVAHCETIDCYPPSTRTTVDSTGDVGQYSSIAIGTDGLPIISYFDTSNTHLKVAHCENQSCTSPATITTVDSSSGVSTGQYSSIAIAFDGYPIISYYQWSAVAPQLKVAHCTNTNCTTSVLNTADSTNGVGQYTSIAINPDSGLASISYYNALNGDLKLARCSSYDCSSPSKITIDSSANNVGQYTSLVYGNDGLALISYFDATAQQLKVAHCGDPVCSAPSIHTLSIYSDSGRYSSITIGADGLPVISFYRVSYGLQVAHCRDIICSNANIYPALNGSLVGQFSTITLGADGLPIISFYEGESQSLQTDHCANAFCVSNYWRR
jgi:hypothetical protein